MTRTMRGLRPDELFELRFLRSACLSPDGRQVAYAVSRTDAEERFEIWVVDLEGRTKRALGYRGNAKNPRWSPDGGWIAFDGDGRLHVLDTASWTVSGPLTAQDLSMQGAPSWSPDSTRVALALLEHRTIDEPRRLVSNRFRADGKGFLDGLRQRIHEVRRDGTASRCLTPTENMCSQPQWSPCGRYILLLGIDYTIPLGQFMPRLLRVDLDNGSLAQILGSQWYVESARWLPSGKRIAIAAARDSTLTYPTTSLWVIDRDGGNAQLRTAGMIGNVGFRTHHDMPALDLTQENTVTVLDDGLAFASVQKGGSVEIWQIALEGDMRADRVLTGQRSCVVLGAHAGSNILLYAVSDLRSPTDLWCATLDTYREKRLTGFNDAIVARWADIDIENFVFASADGTSIEAWTLGPAAGQRPLPTVLFIHGGPFSSIGWAFRFDFVLLASHGYGVVFANFRGSSGYGEPFVRAIMGDWCGRGYPDHIGAAETAVARGFADPARLGVWGPSYGGSATCWIVGHTNRFTAAIAEAAGTNLTTRYYLGDARELYARDLGGKPHEIPDVYRACSPITYAHRCKTPTLLLHGEEDFRCPISEAEQFHTVLRDVGCVTELFRIPGCSHSGDSIGPLSARQAQNEALLRWFQQHL